MRARDIDDVLQQLDDIVLDAIRDDDPIGCFAALYQRVTAAVKRAIVAGDVFDDGPRMARLDTIFANRFLDAWHDDGQGDGPTGPWNAAFDALDRDDLMVVQHLALGMNAHIILDLGVAAAETMAERDEPLEALEADFLRINDVLARLTPLMQVQLGQLSETFATLAVIAPQVQALLFGVMLDGVRDGAWDFARSLADAEDDDAYQQLLDDRIALAEQAAALMLGAGELTDLVARVVDEEAAHSMRHIIQALAG